MPILDPARDFEIQARGFRILGALFGICYQNTRENSFTIGICFDRKLFQIICSLSIHELNQIDADARQLSSEMKLKLINIFANTPLRKILTLVGLPFQDLTLDQFHQLKEFVSSNLEEEEKRPSNLDKEVLSQEEMEELKSWVQASAKATILNQAFQVDDWFPAVMIARQMHRLMGTQWNDLISLGAPGLDAKIQGVMDKTLLLSDSDSDSDSVIEWVTGGLHLDNAKVKKTKGYVKTWIEAATPKDLERLSNFITGSPTISPSKKMRFQLYNGSSETLPNAHTCFFQIDLSINYPTYEVFKKKLELALETVNNLESSNLEAI